MTTKPQIFQSVVDFQGFRKTFEPQKKVGFVPTMGALHQGHASLLNKSVAENDFTVLSIFVNPTQFNNSTDFELYPKTWEADLALASQCGADVILLPTYDQIYPDQYRFKITENDFSKILCGENRPGHFDGVLTVVMKLLQIVQPQRAYFGEKDFQQLQLIKDMAASFFLPLQIISCPTLREESGLALSSRNSRLSSEGLIKAALINKIARKSSSSEQAISALTDHGFQVDYVEDHFNRRFVAAHLEGVRLIDNVEL